MKTEEEIKKEAREWWSSLSINEMKIHLKNTPFYSDMGMDYALSHKNAIVDIYKCYLLLES
jgi:hypothetical protein